MEDSLQAIVHFWFGDTADDALTAQRQSRLWWRKDTRTDQLITRRFAGLVQQACRGELESWLSSPGGRLACILLIDQFGRHIHRGSPAAFAHDKQAQAMTLAGLERGHDRELRPIERVFFYLPLEHSEELAHQQLSVSLISELVAGLDEATASVFASFEDYAARHRDIIERFGRFPHRNEVLGRQSTREELEFLTLPGSSF